MAGEDESGCMTDRPILVRRGDILKAFTIAGCLLAAGCGQSSTPEQVAASVAAEAKSSDEAAASQGRKVAQERGAARARADLRWAEQKDKEASGAN